ncbi:MAG: ribosome small subunit-dependent GTPase A [Spirochaetes bacterium GWF1_31_7]|nr:MAG: ribosome small subunit-dependent GTPase A [Spirochaetes bacterium GWE1_32_154]OHD51762.1 MAG: ribosome small subunit-dependent GTPase A [Spirochaetes bacterium GWF1_31_7]OHD52910.1 MAG: ribosome small subunit-dependent GTPase A [Spirochaetes bacterium GWE2_31_10]OHD80678.1 MAG: ribosome small subunit-dependent GTPase A [Spirochaetes bacterium RIFOXYB1_FULL_32_8]HBD94103.1 ribosome small subunit-dependent GTPase A [Spirochaetia bacterium]
MDLLTIGYNKTIEKHCNEINTDGFELGRIISEQKERYIVYTAHGECDAEITGNMRFSAKGREDFPAVGDWVLLSLYDTNFAIIYSIIPRYSIIKRRSVGKKTDIQIIATNIDYAIIVQSADRDFNLNRIERYLAICNDPNISPIIVITKIDLFTKAEITDLVESIHSRIHTIPVLLVSNTSGDGLNELKSTILKGKTYCFLGSSGVGKSSLINNLSENQIMKTDEISISTNKGRHVTTHREIIIIANGGILIDNPGMREVGMVDTNYAIEGSSDKITELSELCTFSDCTHTHEIGCAVLKAIETGEIELEAYNNYRKLQKEIDHFKQTKAEIRKKDKDFGKMLKNYKKNK